jgi:hypothetical protein
MSNRERAKESAAPSLAPGQILAWLAIAGAIVMGVIGLVNTKALEAKLVAADARLDQVTAKLDGVASKVDNLVAQATARRGPDPNRVYRVNTAGVPSRGAAGAAITIAEFSDFQ